MSQAIDIRTSPVGEGPLWQQVVAQARRRPAAAAVVDGAGDLTYAELVARVEERAAELTVAGVSGGDLVGLRLPRSRDAIVAMLAVLRVGAGYVPIDPAYPVARQEFILADARPRAVITPNGVAATETLAGTEAHAAAGAGAAYVVYTSGSTGRPKGVVVPMSALAAFCAAARQRYELTAADRVLQFASLSFDASVELLGRVSKPLAGLRRAQTTTGRVGDWS
ncbi:AMP-binding protein, partial [Micromonospora sp. DT228]|uniref:AMP-binding protein n=1 Tax=Micromonospora sp. DT228 TaxID=3393443 RepID=UPI003CE958D2